MHRVVMPRIDPGMQTGILVEWLKKEGDPVQKSEPVAIGEGEKTTFDIVAPESGILRRQLYPAKSEVQVTETIAFIGEAGEQLPAEAPLQYPELKPRIEIARDEEFKERAEAQPVSPAARKLARERYIDLSGVKGTGPGGRITRVDVLSLTSETLKPAQNITSEVGHPRVIHESKLSTTRRTIAERLSFSHQNIPSASIMMDVKMDSALRLRERSEASLNKPSVTGIIVKALAKALTEDPTFNSSLEGDLVTTYADANIAVAIQAPKGLVAPVVAQADLKSLERITEEIGLLTEKATTYTLTLNELTGSTATVSNLGPEEVDAFVPIINPPNTVILGVGRISKRPMLVEEKILPISTSTFTLVFDHRVGDGVAASRLLKRIKQLIEEPEILTH